METAVACGGEGGGGSGTSYTVDYTEPPNTAAGNVVLKLNAQGGMLVLDVVVYGNPLGSFQQPLADDKYDDGAQASGCYAPWAVTGPGEVTLTYAVPGDWWIAVSTWNAGGESSTGRDNVGTERTTVGTWINTALPCP